MKSIGKNRTKVAVIAAALFLALFLSAGPLLADPVHVTVWIGANDLVNSKLQAEFQPPSGNYVASFDYNGPIDWQTTSATNTVGSFLTPGLIDALSYSTQTGTGLATFLATTMSMSGNTTVSYFLIEGTYTLNGPNQLIPVAHDDGVSVYMDSTFDGTDWTAGFTGLNHPDQTEEITENATFPGGGTHTFQITYVESNGEPSVLNVAIPTPEPMTLLLLGFGLVGAGLVRRRRS